MSKYLFHSIRIHPLKEGDAVGGVCASSEYVSGWWAVICCDETIRGRPIWNDLLMSMRKWIHPKWNKNKTCNVPHQFPLVSTKYDKYKLLTLLDQYDDDGIVHIIHYFSNISIISTTIIKQQCSMLSTSADIYTSASCWPFIIIESAEQKQIYEVKIICCW